MNRRDAVYAAACLARRWHAGQVDKAGQPYFDGHLMTVGCAGGTRKEQIVGFLHDAAEDTPHTVEEILGALKQMGQVRPSEEESASWIQSLKARIGTPTEEDLQPMTEADWAEIEEGLHLMNHHTAASREEYIERFRGHRTAIGVKLNDLTHNMDLSRIAHPSEKDRARVERYRKEYALLQEMLKTCPIPSA